MELTQETIMRAQMIEQKVHEIEQNLEVVNEQINELEAFKKSLSNFDKSDNNELLASLGKGVYAKTEVKEKELLVNVGKDIYVKKSAKETMAVIAEQNARLMEVRQQLTMRAEAYSNAFQEIIAQIQASQGK
jgi:prefoldin alpha subunit